MSVVNKNSCHLVLFAFIRPLILLLGICFGTSGCMAQVGAFPLNSKNTRILVDSLANQLAKYYIKKEAAIKMSAYLRKRCKEGAYKDVADPHLLAAMLTKDVLFVQKDEHFHVEYNPELASELLGNIEDVPKMVASKLESERVKNFGFKKAEILNGNIGYLEISSFSRLNNYSKATADATLKFLSNANALIIDLRYGVGGSPDMVNHIISHFFKAPTHVSDIYIRCENATLPYWTVPDSSYGQLTSIPIYILTSYKTFSAAEGLAYELQALKRATIVGEVTRGGAHTVSYKPLSSGFICDLPFGEAINPVTHTNWEGKGIIPDVPAEADSALEKAELTIFDEAMMQAKDSVELKKIKWQLNFLMARNHPQQIDTLKLKKYAGVYGAYQVIYRDKQLYYQKTGKALFPLIPMSQTLLRPRGNDTFVVEFSGINGNKASGIVTHHEDGRSEYGVRTE